MTLSVVALRVRIGLNGDGTARYPDFNQLPSVQASGLDWSYYVDRFGGGWCYDKISGHRQESTGVGFNDSPWGTQWGCLLVPPLFATEALALFPGPPFDLSLVPEAQFEQFYNTKVAAHLPEDDIDVEVLEGIRAKLAASEPLTPEDREALDRNHRRRGIRVNREKRWATKKADDGFVMP